MMYPPNIILWFVFLLVASSSKSQRNSMNDDEWSDNSTVQYNFCFTFGKYRNNEVEPITQFEWCVNSFDDEMQNKFDVNFIKNNDKNDYSVRYKSHRHVIKNREQNNQMSTKSSTNSTEINNSILQETNKNLTKIEGESNSTSNELNENTNDHDSATIIIVVPYEACDNITCIRFCCNFGDRLKRTGKCAGVNSSKGEFTFSNDLEDKEEPSEMFLTVGDPCVIRGVGRYQLDRNEYQYYLNGTVHHNLGRYILPTSYCLALLNDNFYDVIICTNAPAKADIYLSMCLLISLPFLLLTFIVYSILPDYQNMHGYTLRAHVAMLFITYTIMYVGQQVDNTELVEWDYCVPLAYIFNFAFLSSFFWLNITCFDIWWTFRKLRSYKVNAKKDKKKFILYSLYAWGITLILNIICIMMDYVPGIPENSVRPNMCKTKFWYSDNNAKMMYFYIPMGITVLINICLFTTTMLTILYLKKHTALQLRDAESKCHNENKQRSISWFIMYLKLFIIMGITWIMELVAWFINTNVVPSYVWYPFNVINALQGVIIFIIFVCTSKMKRLLEKKFRGKCGPFCKIPANNSTTNTASTSFGTSATVPMQESSSPNSTSNSIRNSAM